MKSSIIILILVLGIMLAAQAITLFVHYRINRGYAGIGYWLIGYSLMALGFILMPMVTVEDLKNIPVIANPLLILGNIFLYIGIKKFLGKRLKKWIPISTFIAFNLFYYYYMFIENSVNLRTIVISIALALISFMIVYELLFKKDRLLSSSRNFASIVFLPMDLSM